MKLTALAGLALLLCAFHAEAQTRSSERTRPLPTGPQDRIQRPAPRTSQNTLDKDWSRQQDAIIRRQERINQQYRPIERDIDSQNLMEDGRSWD